MLDAEGSEAMKWTAGPSTPAEHMPTSGIASFFLFMSTHLDIQKHAQDQPGATASSPSNQKSLPYIPPSESSDDIYNGLSRAAQFLKLDMFFDDGNCACSVLKGGMIIRIVNISAIAHDDNLYPNPFVFDPTRHLGENPQLIRLRSRAFHFVQIPRSYFLFLIISLAFGCGRRVGPSATLKKL
ncbi:hypothetical protein B0H12DRAFT_1234942 [Mycena haematopus]|nr:hypothetical protein B0H12DRAFT_1234942 [Mycena haematopus]